MEKRLTNLYVWHDTPTLRLFGSFASTIGIADNAIIVIDPNGSAEIACLANYLSKERQRVRVVNFIWPNWIPDVYEMARRFGKAQCSGDWIFDVRPDEVWPATLIAHIGASWRMWASQGYECVDLQRSQSGGGLRRLFKNCGCGCALSLRLHVSL